MPNTYKPSEMAAAILAIPSVQTSGSSIKGYQTFPVTWTITAQQSIDDFCAIIDADTSAEKGMAFLGKIQCADFPNKSLTNENIIVEILDEDNNNGKNIHIILINQNIYPYKWEYFYHEKGTNTKGWIAYYPIEEESIPREALSLEIQILLDEVESLLDHEAFLSSDNKQFVLSDGLKFKTALE